MNELQSDRPVRQPKEQHTSSNHPPQKHFMNVRINADNQSSNSIIIYSATIIVAIVLVSLLAQYAIPHAVITLDSSSLLTDTSLEHCNNDLIEINKTLRCGPSEGQLKRGRYVSRGGRMNQFFAFYLNFSSGFKDNLQLSKVGLSVENGNVHLMVGQNLIQKQMEINQIPKTNELFYLDFVNQMNEEDQYYWQIELQINSTLQHYSFQLETNTINQQYTIFCIALKSAFLGISILFFVFGLKKFKKYKNMEVLPEQQITLVLSAMTITFNNPLYSISLLLPNLFTTVFSTIFYWNFLIFLFIVWIFFLLRIRDQESQMQTKLFTFKTALYFIPVYIFIYGERIGSSLYQGHNHPLIDNVHRSNIYLDVIRILSFATFMVAVYYIFNLYSNILQQRADLMWRSKVFLNISFIFFVILFFLLLIGAFQVFGYSPKKFIFSMTFTNFYSYYLQYLYYESKTDDEDFQKEMTNRQPSFVEFDDRQISIDLQQDPFQWLEQNDMNKVQAENQTTVSYLGQCFKHQGSQIIASIIRESKIQPKSREQKS